ncbi:MAG TPA: TIM barrel protein [Saprospiraceae bacterium]|nr:TIM barrel protein [Saprospiraceae bacterium]
MDRRDVIRNLSLASASPLISLKSIPTPVLSERKFLHSVCRWCYKDMPLEALSDMAIECGIQSVELLKPSEWDVVQNRGLKVAISYGTTLGIPTGFNDPQYHGQLQSEILDVIPKAADRGIHQIIVFSGNRNGLTDEAGLEHCAVGLDPIVKAAAQYDVRIIMELLNSKINHPDYQCDHTDWGVKLVDKVGSTHFKLLYDIYHMQIMEGDVIHTITAYKDYIAHFHTAGVPGRHEIDESQELNYAAIMKALVDEGFDGFVAQEFIPVSGDPVKSLKRAIEICSV